MTAAQRRKLEKLRDAQLKHLKGALDSLDSKLAKDVDKAIRAMNARAFRPSEVKKQISKLMRAHEKRVGAAVIQQIEDAANYQRIFLARMNEFVKQQLTPIKAADMKWALKEGSAGARHALSYAKLRGSGGAYGLGKRLSRALHGHTKRETANAVKVITRSVREAARLNFASTELVKNVRLGKAEKLPKLVQDVQDKINRIGNRRMLGADFEDEARRLKKYLRRLKAGGRVRIGYLELVDSLTKKGGVSKKAVEKYAYHRQRYIAERIINTETQTAYRQSQLQAGRKEKYIVGYIWRLNRSVHARWLKKKPGRKTGKRGGKISHGRSCICEVNAGKRFTKEEAAEWTAMGMGHPHCSCWWEEVFDKSKI